MARCGLTAVAERDFWTSFPQKDAPSPEPSGMLGLELLTSQEMQLHRGISDGLAQPQADAFAQVTFLRTK